MRKLLRVGLLAAPIAVGVPMLAATAASAHPGTPGARIILIDSYTSGNGCTTFIVRWKDDRGHVYDELNTVCLGGKSLDAVPMS